MKTLQRWVPALFLITLVTQTPCASEWLDIGGDGIDRLYYLIKIHENFLVEIAGQEKPLNLDEIQPAATLTEWGEIFVDLQNKKLAVKIYQSENKPAPEDTPIRVEIISATPKLQITSILNDKKISRYEEISESKWKSSAQGIYQILLAGRHFAGESLPFLIKEASESHKIKQETDSEEFSHIFISAAPLVTQPTAGLPLTDTGRISQNSFTANISLDKNFQPIKITSPFGTFSYKWDVADSQKFPYVIHFTLDRKVNGVLLRNEQSIMVLKVNPDLSPDLFNAATPDNYSKKDTRMLLTPPQF